jgi:hypothetical protein
MLSVFHVPVWSASHPIVQVEPCWETCPGLGDVGETSAKAVNAMDKTTVVKALRENIEDGCCCVGNAAENGRKSKVGGGKGEGRNLNVGKLAEINKKFFGAVPRQMKDEDKGVTRERKSVEGGEG